MTSKRRVLVVDDDEILLGIYERDLSRWGYRVATSTGAEDLVARVRGFRPDLVLMDRMLTNDDGVDLAEAITRALGPDAPPVLVISGSEDQERSGDPPAVARYLPKGLKPERLRQLMTAAVMGHRLSFLPPCPTPDTVG